MNVAPVVRRARAGSKGRALQRAARFVVLSGLVTAWTAGAATATPPYNIKPPPPKPGRYDVATTVAIAEVATWIRRAPSLTSGEVKRLVFYTPDREALQTYRIITRRSIRVRVSRYRYRYHFRYRYRTTVWDQIDVPGRPNGQTGWVEQSWIGSEQTSHTLIVVSQKAEHIWVYRYGKLIFNAPAGTGNVANKTNTPTGHFWIAEAFPSTDPFYGPWAFGTTDYARDTEFPDGSIVGIHGTNEPWLIPGDPSHGCVRLKNPDILKLKRLVGIGTAVWIQ